MAISILFFVRKRSRANFFELFAKVFRRFRPRRNFFDGPIFFSNFSWQRCDSFGPKIVEIGAILAIFQPFEIFRIFFSLYGAVNHKGKIRRDLNPQPHLTAILNTFPAKYFSYCHVWDDFRSIWAKKNMFSLELGRRFSVDLGWKNHVFVRTR